MSKWILLISLAWVWSGCAIHPNPSSEPRTKTDSVEGQPPPDVEKTEPPRRPATTCPPAMQGSC
jgi:PBP1b-binding outer membrane lipoprotein LpoB